MDARSAPHDCEPACRPRRVAATRPGVVDQTWRSAWSERKAASHKRRSAFRLPKTPRLPQRQLCTRSRAPLSAASLPGEQGSSARKVFLRVRSRWGNRGAVMLPSCPQAIAARGSLGRPARAPAGRAQLCCERRASGCGARPAGAREAAEPNPAGASCRRRDASALGLPRGSGTGVLGLPNRVVAHPWRRRRRARGSVPRGRSCSHALRRHVARQHCQGVAAGHHRSRAPRRRAPGLPGARATGQAAPPDHAAEARGACTA